MKPIPSAPGYEACSRGSIWRRSRRLSGVDNGHGYLRVKLSVNNQQRDEYVHRLVCEAYHGPCPPGKQCRHKDGNRANNKPSNLAWSSKAQNEADKFDHGTNPAGERHGRAKLTDDLVIEARRRAALDEMVEDIARDMGLPYRRLLDAVAGRRWKHIPGAPKLIKGAQRRQIEKKLATGNTQEGVKWPTN